MTDKAIKEFIDGINRGPFKVLKEYIKGERISEIVEDEARNIYRCAIDQGYLDMCRTVSDFSGVKKNTLDCAADCLEEYFDSKKTSEKNFDKWHGDTVNEIMIESKESLSVGQCQKIINMSFKYLYCCDDFRDDKSRNFEFCHMPLDSYTLEWYKEKFDNKKEHSEIKWSTIEDYNKYHEIIKNIRIILKGKVVLEEEFSIWNDIKKKRTLREFENSIISLQEMGFDDKRIRKELNDCLIKKEKKDGSR